MLICLLIFGYARLLHAVSKGLLSSCSGFSCCRAQAVGRAGFSSCSAGSVVVTCGLSCPAGCGILPDQGSNPCPLHCQAHSQPLDHQANHLKSKNISLFLLLYHLLGFKVGFWAYPYARLQVGKRKEIQYQKWKVSLQFCCNYHGGMI